MDLVSMQRFVILLSDMFMMLFQELILKLSYVRACMLLSMYGPDPYNFTYKMTFIR